MFEKRIGQKPGNTLHRLFWFSISQSIKPGRLSRKGALNIRERRERRHKTVPKFPPGKQKKKTHFWPEIVPLF